METNKIIAALRCCASIGWSGCDMCQREELDDEEVGCGDVLKLFAADRLEELVDRCARYAEEIAVLRERQRWISAAERRPETDDFVLGVVNGVPTENITLVNAVQIASYCENDGGWWLPEYPRWEYAEVSYWMPLPDAPGVIAL